MHTCNRMFQGPIILPSCFCQLPFTLLSRDCSAKMTDLDDLYRGMEVDDDLSTDLGTETFAERDMVPARSDQAAELLIRVLKASTALRDIRMAEYLQQRPNLYIR